MIKRPFFLLGRCCHALALAAILTGPLLGTMGAAAADGGLIRPSHVAAPPAAEDLLAVPDTRWVIASAVSIGPEAVPGIYLVSNDPPHLQMLLPEIGSPPRGSACPAPLNAKGFSPLGMSWGEREREGRELLVINRGSRKAIEIFSFVVGSGTPRLKSQDCIPLPANVTANSIAAHPDGGVLVTQSSDPADDQAWAKQVRGEVTGQLYFWRPGAGWSPVEGSAVSGANGLVVSADGCYAIVAAWAERRLLRVPLDCSTDTTVTTASVDVPFLPDNLRWTDRGSLLATGQMTTPDGLLACVKGTGPCPPEVAIVEIDPAAMSILRQWRLDAGATLGLGTTAVQVDDAIWLSSILGRVIGRFAP